jgi:hypothetical protein
MDASLAVCVCVKIQVSNINVNMISTVKLADREADWVCTHRCLICLLYRAPNFVFVFWVFIIRLIIA